MNDNNLNEIHNKEFIYTKRRIKRVDKSGCYIVSFHTVI